MKDTLRILTTLKCNLSYSYCCNNLFKFEQKYLANLNLQEYNNICITGGEPLLPGKIHLLRHLLLRNELLDENIFTLPNVYIYTNGIYLNHSLLNFILDFNKVKGINIGIHPGSNNRILLTHKYLCKNNKIRFMIEDKYKSIINFAEYKGLNYTVWTRDRCDMPNEDWVLLKDN